MRIALEEAALGDYPFGAVIVRDGEVLARGRNLGKQQQDPTAHGEMVAIRHFLAAHGTEKLKGTTLYTSGKSCPMCMGAIVWCGIARVVYGASIAQLATKIGQIMVTDAEIADKTPFADIALTGGVLAEEFAEALQIALGGYRQWMKRRSTATPWGAWRKLWFSSAAQITRRRLPCRLPPRAVPSETSRTLARCF